MMPVMIMMMAAMMYSGERNTQAIIPPRPPSAI